MPHIHNLEVWVRFYADAVSVSVTSSISIESFGKENIILLSIVGTRTPHHYVSVAPLCTVSPRTV
jgi:hypothetical protein